MQWLPLVAVLVIIITAAYVMQMSDSDYGLPLRSERFMDFIGAPEAEGVPDGRPELAHFSQGLPLSDFLPVETGLTDETAVSCAAEDQARAAELGGQYVQRTNNYRRDYPDHCSSLQSDFVGGFYKPKKGGVGATLPCPGSC